MILSASVWLLSAAALTHAQVYTVTQWPSMCSAIYTSGSLSVTVTKSATSAASSQPSLPDSAVNAGQVPFVIRVDQPTPYGYTNLQPQWLMANGNTTSDGTQAEQYILQDGVLQTVDGQYISTDAGLDYQVMAVSPFTLNIQTTMSVMNGLLIWTNPAFPEQDQAQFYKIPLAPQDNSQVIVWFSGDDFGGNWAPVALRVRPVSDVNPLPATYSIPSYAGATSSATASSATSQEAGQGYSQQSMSPQMSMSSSIASISNSLSLSIVTAPGMPIGPIRSIIYTSTASTTSTSSLMSSSATTSSSVLSPSLPPVMSSSISSSSMAMSSSIPSSTSYAMTSAPSSTTSLLQVSTTSATSSLPVVYGSASSSSAPLPQSSSTSSVMSMAGSSSSSSSSVMSMAVSSSSSTSSVMSLAGSSSSSASSVLSMAVPSSSSSSSVMSMAVSSSSSSSSVMSMAVSSSSSAQATTTSTTFTSSALSSSQAQSSSAPAVSAGSTTTSLSQVVVTTTTSYSSTAVSSSSTSAYLVLASPTPCNFGDPAGTDQDDSYCEIDLPSSMRMYSMSSSQTFASTNGFVSLMNGSSQYQTSPLPYQYIPNSTVLPLMDDLYLYGTASPTQGIFYQANTSAVTYEYYVGSANNSAAIAHFTVAYTFATPGVFTYTYYNVMNGANGITSSVGMQGVNSAGAVQSKQYSYQTSSIFPGMVLVCDTNQNTCTRTQ